MKYHLRAQLVQDPIYKKRDGERREREREREREKEREREIEGEIMDEKQNGKGKR